MERPTATRSDEDRARADTAFLVGSWNRLEVLETVAAEPHTRSALGDSVDVFRVTLSRILSDLEGRGWLVREGETYEATPAGVHVASELRRLLANLRTVNHLGEHDEGAPPGTVASTDDTVGDWAESSFDARRAESHRLRPGSFTP